MSDGPWRHRAARGPLARLLVRKMRRSGDAAVSSPPTQHSIPPSAWEEITAAMASDSKYRRLFHRVTVYNRYFSGFFFFCQEWTLFHFLLLVYFGWLQRIGQCVPSPSNGGFVFELCNRVISFKILVQTLNRTRWWDLSFQGFTVNLTGFSPHSCLIMVTSCPGRFSKCDVD